VPSWIDEDGDDVTVTASLDGLSLPFFVTFKNPYFSFAPIEADIGTYPIRVTLTDSGDPQKETKRTF